jgi:hypothetical protein
MADNLVYEESLNTEIDTSEFISKKWVYVNDNNSQNYTSQVVIDSTPLSNAGGYINWQEGFIVMPLVVQLTSANGASLPVGTSIGDFTWGFKSGFWNMINSMTVEFNNQNVIQQTPFLNVFRSFKSLTSYSLDDLLNVGPTTGFYPDDADTWSYNNLFQATADGGFPTPYASFGNTTPYTNNCNYEYLNNNITSTTAPLYVAGPQLQCIPSSSIAGQPIITGGTAVSFSGRGGTNFLTKANKGFLNRQKWYNYNALSQANSSGQSIINNVASTTTVYRSGLVESTAGSLVWNVYAKLRLKDLADFFEKMPLLKGSTIRFYINTNQSVVKFTTTIGAITAATGVTTLDTSPTLTITESTVVGGLTCPLMVASNFYGNGSSTLPADDYALSVSIVKNNFLSANSGSTTLKSCRLYAPVYYMNPLAESKYLSLTPTKRIMYKDVFQYQFNDQGTGNFNILVSNGISNIVSVLLIPFLSNGLPYTDSANAPANVLISSPLSPTCPCPSVPDPITLTNVNFLISGINLFLNNEYYDYEAFLEQLNQSNQLNGGLTTGLASGLISEYMFSSGYRYYYGDASRILPSEQGVSRSVQIVGNNVSSVKINLMVFVEFMREITIDISTGARIE